MIHLFDDISNMITTAITAIIVVICLVIALKSEHFRKLCLYIIAIVCILFGGYCTIGLIKDVTAESYTNGSLEQRNTYGQDVFSYKSSSIYFTKENDNYICEKNLIRVNNFDGENNEYNIVFNDYLILDSDITSGSINFDIIMEFRTPDSSANVFGDLHISIKFLSDKTYMKISTDTQVEAEYFTDYFKNFGFNLSCYDVE